MGTYRGNYCLMNWDAIGAIGEVGGAVAVVVSLVYVAYQIRQNTRALRSSTGQAMLDYGAATAQSVTIHRELAELARRGEEEPESLDSVDWYRFVNLSILRFAAWEQAFLNHREGLLDEERWRAWEGANRHLFDNPGTRRFWEQNRPVHSPSFQSYIDARVFPGG